MKGVFIHNQLEFRLEVPGEDFCQGDSLQCALSVKNHGTTPLAAPPLRLDLALADLKKMKERKEGAFENVASAECSALGELAPKEQKSINWKFNLDPNCPISHKAESLCFLYGAKDNSSPLPITVNPHRHIQKFISFFESPFQFQVKGQKSADGWVQVKLKPPSSRRLAQLDELMICFAFKADALRLKYVFKIKTFAAAESANAVGIKKEKSELEQEIKPENYLLTPEHLNNEVVEARIEEALGTVAAGI